MKAMTTSLMLLMCATGVSDARGYRGYRAGEKMVQYSTAWPMPKRSEPHPSPDLDATQTSTNIRLRKTYRLYRTPKSPHLHSTTSQWPGQYFELHCGPKRSRELMLCPCRMRAPGLYRRNNVPDWQRLHQRHDGLRQWDKV